MGTTVLFSLAVALEQFLDEPTRLQAIERFDGNLEEFFCQSFDVLFVESVLIDQLEDEFFLFVRARPSITGLLVDGVEG